ncbi:MAG: hypothetical protein AAGC63_15065 [Propionicimonas sp.]|nr:hypothetical protein [Propionicimonas sp.]
MDAFWHPGRASPGWRRSGDHLPAPVHGDDFAASQQPCYHDPARVALPGALDYLADYAIHPARQLELP